MVIVKNANKIIKVIGFVPVDGYENRFQYVAKYKDKEINTFVVDFDAGKNGKINWGKVSDIEHGRSSNLSKKESIVQLFWVIKLIESGYKPDKIAIEKEVQVGRKSGYIDIVVYDETNTPFLILDVKKDGEEFEKYASELEFCQGQIASYFSFNTNTKYIGVISAEFHNKFVEDYSFIVSTEGWKKAGSASSFATQLRTKLSNSFSIDSTLEPYGNKFITLYQDDLKELNESSSSLIFHRFLTILRRHGISDKTNAFNRVLNLFIAKIVDEFNTPDKKPLKFQTLNEETDEEFLSKIDSLYSQGLREFIEIHIDSDKDIEKIISAIEDSLKPETSSTEREIIYNLVRRLQSKNNPSFQFKDVYDEVTYHENIELMKELVRLIAPFKFKYAKKQQFLGDFFENILANGFKQESGQFFTPVPLARFMVESLPLEYKIESILKDDSRKLLPLMIDFASGSGHFLTEYMDRTQSLLEQIDCNNLSRDNKKRFEQFLNDPFTWSSEYVYGLDVDYRLVKTSKVSSFLNGDGDAIIRRGNGLSSFDSSDYVDDLYVTGGKTENHRFDILIANPPYHVDDFQEELPNVSTDFVLSKFLTENSSEIEALFIERASQLLKQGGYVAIILPSSILDTEPSIYVEARKLLLRDFEIKAIMKNPKATFSATSVETVTIFGVKRSKNYFDTMYRSLSYMDGSTIKDISFNGQENFISKYVKNVYGHNFSLEDYIDFRSGNFNFDNRVVETYRRKFENSTLSQSEIITKISEIEDERMVYFSLLSNKLVVIQSQSDKSADEVELLGYKFIGRRGHEGIHPRIKNYTIDDLTLLYGEKGYFLDKIVRSSFLDSLDDVEKNEVIMPYYRITEGYKLVDFNNINNINKIRIQNAFSEHIKDYGDVETISLREYADLENGTSITLDQIETGDIPVIAGGRTPAYYIDEANRDGDVITISKSGAYAGYVSYHSEPIFSSDSFTIKAKKNSPYTTRQLYYLLKNKQDTIYNYSAGSVQKHIYISDMENFRIPRSTEASLNLLSVLKNEYEQKLKNELELQKQRNIKREFISNFVKNQKVSIETLGSLEEKKIIKISGGKRIPKELDYSPFETTHYYPTVGDFEDGGINLEKSKFIDDKTFEVIKRYELKESDVYISAAGTIGKVGVLPTVPEGYTVSLTENAHKVTANELLHRDYIAQILTADSIQQQLNHSATRTGTPKLSISSLKNLQIPFVDADMQKEFLEHIHTIDETINQLKNSL